MHLPGACDQVGADAAELPRQTLDEGVRAGRFLILTHPEVATYLARKAGDRDRWIRGMQRFRGRLAKNESGG